MPELDCPRLFVLEQGGKRWDPESSGQKNHDGASPLQLPVRHLQAQHSCCVELMEPNDGIDVSGTAF